MIVISFQLAIKVSCVSHYIHTTWKLDFLSILSLYIQNSEIQHQTSEFMSYCLIHRLSGKFPYLELLSLLKISWYDKLPYPPKFFFAVANKNNRCDGLACEIINFAFISLNIKQKLSQLSGNISIFGNSWSIFMEFLIYKNWLSSINRLGRDQ